MSNKAKSEIRVFQDDMSVRAEKGDVMGDIELYRKLW